MIALKLVIAPKTVATVNHAMTGAEARRIRRNAKLTGKRVAALMAISQPYYCDLEYGKRNWNDAMVGLFNTALRLANNNQPSTKRKQNAK